MSGFRCCSPWPDHVAGAVAETEDGAFRGVEQGNGVTGPCRDFVAAAHGRTMLPVRSQRLRTEPFEALSRATALPAHVGISLLQPMAGPCCRCGRRD